MQPTNEYLIHRYLSGELLPDEEQQLFDLLSESEELRNELNLQLRLQQEAQRDLPAISVPPATTKSIFSSLGFTAPLGAGPLLPSSGNRLFGFTSSKLAAVLSVASILIAIATFAYMMLNDPKTNEATDPEAITAKAVEMMTSKEAKAVSPVTSTTAAPQQVALELHTERETASLETKPAEAPQVLKVIPNEPIKAYFDIGKFASVDYLTQMKIIGVADAGKIYCSEDGGKSWVLQESKTSNDLFGINFIDTARGVVVGANGTVLLTPNAGRRWEKVETHTTLNLITVRYATRDTVYACGAGGAILRSTSGGRDWQALESGTTASLFKIRFSNGSQGVVSGERGITLQTQNAGMTWEVKN